MARELAPEREGQRVTVIFRLKRVKPADLAVLIEHMDKMAEDLNGEYETTQQRESVFPPGA